MTRLQRTLWVRHLIQLQGDPARRRRNMHRHSTGLGFGNLPRERGILCDVWSPAEALCMLQLRQSPRMFNWTLCTECHGQTWSVRWLSGEWGLPLLFGERGSNNERLICTRRRRRRRRGESSGKAAELWCGGELKVDALFQPGSPGSPM